MKVRIGPSLPGERVRLSTGGSQWLKVRLAIGSVVIAVATVLSRERSFLVFAGLLLVSAVISSRLSEVETDGLYLYVSNLRRRLRVPLNDVAEVSVGPFPRLWVIVDLHVVTPMGTRIVYRPPMDWSATANDHRAVRELRALVAQARAWAGAPHPTPAASAH